MFAGKSFEDSDVRPYRRPRVVADESTQGPGGDWKRKLAENKPRPQLDVDAFKIKIKGQLKVI